MHTIKDGMNGLSLIANLNWDRFMFLGMIAAALFAAGFLVTL